MARLGGAGGVGGVGAVGEVGGVGGAAAHVPIGFVGFRLGSGSASVEDLAAAGVRRDAGSVPVGRRMDGDGMVRPTMAGLKPSAREPKSASASASANEAGAVLPILCARILMTRGMTTPCVQGTRHRSTIKSVAHSNPVGYVRI